jgi:hypothetical protein
MMINNTFTSEDLKIIAEYLERLGVEGLRHPHHLNQVNKRAVIRYLITEKLQEALANPPEPEGQRHRVGQAANQRKPSTSVVNQSPSLRKRS